MAVPQKNEERLMTGEELARRPDLTPCELVNGRVVPMAPAGHTHGEVESRLDVELGLYARETGSGSVASRTRGMLISARGRRAAGTLQ